MHRGSPPRRAGRTSGFGVLLRSLPRRRRHDDELRESEQRFRLLVSSVTDYAIFLLSPEGIVTSWNLGAERLKGYAADEIIGAPFTRFYTDEDQRRGLPETGLRTAREEGRWEHEGWRVRRDGSRFWADVVITALRGPDGDLRGFAKVTRDLTDRKRHEDELLGLLEREREAAARLTEADRMRTQLVAMIAHDLRAPIGVIRHLIDILSDDWASLDEVDKLRLLGRASDRAAGLAVFVEDAFDVARIEAGQLDLVVDSFDLAEVIAEAVDDALLAHPDRRIHVQGDGPSFVVADRRRCRQVLTNLLSNALKFSDPDDEVTITLTGDGAEVVASVADAGPGIAADQVHLLFEPFSRLSQAAGPSGSGLGLYIARSLVEAQGGRIWVEPGVGHGSTFSFTLPAEAGR